MRTEEVWSWELFLMDAESSSELRAAILEMANDEDRPAIAKAKFLCASIKARIICVESLLEIAP